ncbi:MAG: polysaccharide biosynthesis/export family protein [Pseudomonadota bacterium]
MGIGQSQSDAMVEGSRSSVLANRGSLLCLLLLVVGCADRAIAPYPTSPPPPIEDSALGPGDTFDVRVFGEDDLSGTYQVAVDGTINYPLIGTVVVDGKTPTQVEREIQTRLGDGYLKLPQVSVLPKEYQSKKISVFGQVKQPGTFAYREDISIVEAISRAGGFTAMAKKNAVRVTRHEAGATRKIVVAVEDIGQGKAPNFHLRPGDVVFVPERIF